MSANLCEEASSQTTSTESPLLVPPKTPPLPLEEGPEDNERETSGPSEDASMQTTNRQEQLPPTRRTGCIDLCAMASEVLPLDTIRMPSRWKPCGRPKGSDLTVIGLPRKKTERSKRLNKENSKPSGKQLHDAVRQEEGGEREKMPVGFIRLSQEEELEGNECEDGNL